MTSWRQPRAAWPGRQASSRHAERARAAVSLRRQSRPHVEQRGLQHPSSPKDGDVLRFALQRRFGLHLSMMTDVMADGIYSQHGLPFDALGDVAQNDGAAGHQTRHKEVLLDLVELLRGKLGRGAVEHEFHCEHSTTRTDLYIFRVILQIEKCLTGAEAEEKRGAAESLAPTDPSSVDE